MITAYRCGIGIGVHFDFWEAIEPISPAAHRYGLQRLTVFSCIDRRRTGYPHVLRVMLAKAHGPGQEPGQQ
jgi:hypothetical protein